MTESAKIQQFRRAASKFGVSLKRTKHGYRFFTADKFDSVKKINGVDCAGILTLEQVEEILSTLIADKEKNCVEIFGGAKV